MLSQLKSHLNFIGLGLVAASLVGLWVLPQHRTRLLILAALGLAALVAYLAFNLSSLKRGLKRRSFIYSSSMLVVVVLVLAILVVANYFLQKHHLRVDFTATKLHSLSDQSTTVLRNLKQDINVKAFFREGNYGRGTMENLLKIYAYHSGKLKSEFIDPDKNPGLVKRYGITQDGTTILEAGDKEGRVTTTTEEDVTNAIIKVTREKKKTIYFLEGHGEQTVEESGDDGYSTVKSELEKLSYEVKKLTLALAANFPADCALLVVPGPQKDLLPNELETIKDYISKGGRVQFMIDPETAPGMTGFLTAYGVKLGDDIVVDTVSRLLGGDYFMPVVSEYEFHEITQRFRYATFFPFARSISLVEPKPEAATLTLLAKTSPNSWAERQLTEKEVKFDAGKDQQGPISLAVAGTWKGAAQAGPEEKPATEPLPDEKPKAEEPKPAPEARFVVIGDADFVKNRYYGLSGNGNFFLNAVNWLTEESDLISILPKTQSPRTIQLTPSQGRLLFFVSVIILPLAVLLFGLSVWLRRRSL
jgi:ABC-type uncharacterized transport system involved in gliding motility auxiliary subunit